MRTFKHGSGADRKTVAILVEGNRVVIVERKADGEAKRNVKDLPGPDQARAASEKMAKELLARGFVEKVDSSSALPKVSAASTPAPAKAKTKAPSRPSSDADEVRLGNVFDEDGPPLPTAPVLPRVAPAAPAAADGAKKKAGAKKKKKRKKAESPDGLDRRVLAGIGALGIGIVAVAGFLVYDTFLKPPSIVGVWSGSRLDYEVGRAMTHMQYRLVLDAEKHAALTVQEDLTSKGTYTVEKGMLKLHLDDDGEKVEQEYKISLGRATLDLYDPTTGKKVVELVRNHEMPKSGGSSAPAPPEAPKDLAGGPVDAAVDAQLASIAFAPKDDAFKIRHPPGWEAETGSRPDNTYSWARFTKGSAKIQVFADVQGSLMSGSDSARDVEPGSEMAPVHTAHTLYKKTAAEEFEGYTEGPPAVFNGSQVGEGRVAAFNASTGGILGSKVKGLRVTLLTNNRRVTLLCSAPTAEFEKLKPTFLAVCRSVSR